MGPVQEERVRHIAGQLLPLVGTRGKGAHRLATILEDQAAQLVAVPGRQALANKAGDPWNQIKRNYRACFDWSFLHSYRRTCFV